MYDEEKTTCVMYIFYVISSLFNVVYNNLLTPFLEDLPKQSLVFNSHLKMDLK